MKYKGTLIVVKDCNRSLKFYSDMFGFQLLQDNDGNMELTNNLYLQELGYWEQFTKRNVIPNSNQSELYFEEPDIEQFVERLETLYPEIEYVNHLMTHTVVFLGLEKRFSIIMYRFSKNCVQMTAYARELLAACNHLFNPSGY